MKIVKIVKFNDGYYGIRSGWLKYRYLSIYDANNRSTMTWMANLPIHHFCKGSLEDVRKVMSWITDCGVPVDAS